jgi:signal transduction histidine kinase
MCLLAVLLAWLVRRSRTAQAQLAKVAEQNVRASRDRERLMQLTSHELRTPLTIARGYIEVMQTRELEDPQDLSVVADELDRLAQVSDRLIRMMKLQDDRTMEVVDVDQIMAQSVERWRVVAHRRWVLDAHAGHCLGSAGRLRTILDTLVENAIRYTSVGDTIRLAGRRQSQYLTVSVFDSGVGLTDHQIPAINAGAFSAPATAPTTTDTDPDTDSDDVLNMDPDNLAGTGLGLSIVRRAVNARGGTLHASHAPEGGAGLTITYPLNQPREIT